MAPRPGEIVRFIGRSSKRIAVTAVGFALVAAGLAMLVLPGPGIVVVVAGFAVLGTEYAWAAAVLERTKRAAEAAGRVTKGGVSRAARGANGLARSTGRRLFRRDARPAAEANLPPEGGVIAPTSGGENG